MSSKVLRCIVLALALGACRSGSGVAGEPIEPGRLRSEIRWLLVETWPWRAFNSHDGSYESVLMKNRRTGWVSRHAEALEPEARRIVADAGESYDAKLLAVYAMQCLPLHKLVDFIRFMMLEVTAGRCAPELVSDAIYPGEGWGDAIALSHDQPEVRRLLEEIRDARIGGPAGVEHVEGILSGEAKEFAEYLRAGPSGLRPEWRCGEAGGKRQGEPEGAGRQ